MKQLKAWVASLSQGYLQHSVVGNHLYTCFSFIDKAQRQGPGLNPPILRSEVQDANHKTFRFPVSAGGRESDRADFGSLFFFLSADKRHQDLRKLDVTMATLF